MTVQSINFADLDLAYIINYEDGGDVLMLGSNDPAMDSLTNAKEILTDSISNYADISDLFNVVIQKVTWRKDNASIKFEAIKKEGWPKRRISSSTSISYAGKREIDIEPARSVELEDIEDLQKEVEKYLMGQRMQKELPFQE